MAPFAVNDHSVAALLPSSAVSLPSFVPTNTAPLREPIVTGATTVAGKARMNLATTAGPGGPANGDCPVCCATRPYWPHVCTYAVGLADAVTVTVAVNVGETVALADTDGVSVGDTDVVGVSVRVNDRVGVVDGDGDVLGFTSLLSVKAPEPTNSEPDVPIASDAEMGPPVEYVHCSAPEVPSKPYTFES